VSYNELAAQVRRGMIFILL